ncbi:MAG: nitrate reductase subunit beta [Dehalococcoidales bacterium]|nr:nitrate reductase subunit beta [Dehalococcoidales bacterium]MDP7525248.1 nitrate reductase subunit beta [Dehalococcoidales bacterium]
MDVRAQIATTFHLDKCIGCHTCSLACNNLWTSRPGTEYMWWNNVETKPGTGYPTLWEDQDKYRGGWELKGNSLRPRLGGRVGMLTNLFYNPYLPAMDDYYEPWTYQYDHLFNAPQGPDQPTARPISKVTGQYLDLEAGPNWDDDLGGSPVYARNDVNLAKLTETEQQALFSIEQKVFFYLPRICNHCLNPGCVGVCPSGAIYKRAEDGVVLVSQEKCRGWRFCVSGCPYKKPYYNWDTGKSEKCILCYPRMETGQAPACFHSCVGRIRYIGVLLYDADRIEEITKVPEAELVAAQRSLILDPADPEVIAAAKKNGIDDEWLEAARKSPTYKFVKEWEVALPLHSEFRTLPMLFYIPPLLPVVATTENGNYNVADSEFFGSIETSRIPIQYMASLFSAGNEEIIKKALRILWAVRSSQQASRVGLINEDVAAAQLAEAGITAEIAEEISRLTALPRVADRYVLPPYHREMAIEELTGDTQQHKYEVGFGSTQSPRRGP